MYTVNGEFYGLSTHELRQYTLGLLKAYKVLQDDLTSLTQLNHVLELIKDRLAEANKIQLEIDGNKRCQCNEVHNLKWRKLLQHLGSELYYWTSKYHQLKKTTNVDSSAISFDDRIPHYPPFDLDEALNLEANAAVSPSLGLFQGNEEPIGHLEVKPDPESLFNTSVLRYAGKYQGSYESGSEDSMACSSSGTEAVSPYAMNQEVAEIEEATSRNAQSPSSQSSNSSKSASAYNWKKSLIAQASDNSRNDQQVADINEVSARPRSYFCSWPGCDLRYKRRKNLRLHEKLHLNPNEKKHKCEFCEKAFRRSSHLTKHRRIHTGEKPHVCSFCGMGFAEKGNYNRHIKVVHFKSKSFTCNWPNCNMQYTTKTNLERHQKLHPGSMGPYICDHCGREFSRKFSLVLHTKTHIKSPTRAHYDEFMAKPASLSNTLIEIGSDNKPTPATAEQDLIVDIESNDDIIDAEQKDKENKIDSEKPSIINGMRRCSFKGCCFFWKTQADLDDHRRNHIGDNLWKCDARGCNYQLRSERGLQIHKHQHH